MGYAVDWARQLRLVLVKDYIIAKRNYQGIVRSIVVPVVFILLILLLQLLSDNSQFSSLTLPVRNGEVTKIGPIPKCFLPKQTGVQCITLAFSPKDDTFVTNLIEEIRVANGLEKSEIRGFDTNDDLDTHLSGNRNTTQGAYHFFPQRDQAAAVVGMRYLIQFNDTGSTFRGKTFDPKFQVAIPMQKAADVAIAKALLTKPTVQLDYNYAAFPHPELLIRDVTSQAGPTFFFGALMFNFIAQLGRLVNEKELNLRASMTLMGLQQSVYWTSSFIVVFVYNFISAFVLSISGLIFQLTFFKKNAFGLYFFLFVLFGMAMTSLVAFMSVFVSKSRSATALGMGIFFVGFLTQAFSQLIFVTERAGWIVFLFELLPFAILSQGLSGIGKFSSTSDSIGMRWAQRSSNDPFFPLTRCYSWLVLDTLIYFILAIYLDEVLPDDNGVRKHILYFLKPSYWSTSSKYVPLSQDELIDTTLDLEKLDIDVASETILARDASKPSQFKLINVQKCFPGRSVFGLFPNHSKDFHAVRGVDLILEPNKLFCLLGHNGAGKTTLLNMLTGLTTVTRGDALILNKSIRSQMPEIQRQMGVCPQYDILWEQLTAYEHLTLFAGFKKIARDKVDQEVTERLTDVDLLEHADSFAGLFSGGMRRRLSVAIALIGNPEVVYLDEPTTGMDPVSRRKVWNLIEKIKHKRITILTTHSMEESDVLGDRIGIMNQGRLVCLGNSVHLKQRFGSGYRITIRTEIEKLKLIEKLFLDNLKGSTVLLVENDTIKFNVPRTCSNELPGVFTSLEQRKDELAIKDTQLSLSTMEEVFLAVGGMGEHDARIGTETETKTVFCTTKKKIGGVVICLLIIVIMVIVKILAAKNEDFSDIAKFPSNKRLSELTKGVWQEIEGTNLTRCSRGDPFSFFVKPGSSSNLLLEFQGGGVCSDLSSCSPSYGLSAFNATVSDSLRTPLKYGNNSGIFMQVNGNPFKGWTHVIIPHCSADSFIGDKTQFYDAGVSIRHWGAPNAQSVLNWVYENVPTATTPNIAVSSWSAAALGAAFWTFDIADHYQSSNILLLVDSFVDVSTGDWVMPPGGTTFNDVQMEYIVGVAGDEYRLAAFAAWGAQSSAATPAAFRAVPNFERFSLQNVLTRLLSHGHPSLVVGQFNFADQSVLSQTMISRLFASQTAKATLAGDGFNQTDLTTAAKLQGPLGTQLKAAICRLIKSANAKLVAAASGGKYAGFIATGTDNAGGMLSLPTFNSATGLPGPTKLPDWIKTLIGSPPTGPFTQINDALCI